jgi:hypothetical protein
MNSPVKLILLLVIVAMIASAGVFIFTYQGTKTIILTRTTTQTQTTTTTSLEYCSLAAENTSISNDAFKLDIQYSADWNATLMGYTNGSTIPAFAECLYGSGDAIIGVHAWASIGSIQNPSGELTLNATIQKDDGSDNNLTAILYPSRGTTTAPFGVVDLSASVVP